MSKAYDIRITQNFYPFYTHAHALAHAHTVSFSHMLVYPNIPNPKTGIADIVEFLPND